ncbi:MAG: hypothetical protein PVG33_11120, partial [Chloroflexota bacterium]
MSEDRLVPPIIRSRRILLSIVLAALMLAVVFQTLSANWVETPALPPDLSNSSKSVDRNEAKIDDDLKYSITMRNDGGATAELV